MSVFMTLTVDGDPKGAEQWAADNTDKMQSILEAAKRHGLIAHRFYGSDDGRKVMVLDEWPDRQSFEAFFQEQQPEIQSLFDAIKPTGEPQPIYWKELNTGDAYGWGV